MSRARDDRPGFAERVHYLREGDTLIVWRLDRLGRNMRGIVNTLHELTERGVTVRSLRDGVDTSTSTGRMVAGILMSIAEYERELVRERTALEAGARPEVWPQVRWENAEVELALALASSLQPLWEARGRLR